MIKRNKKTKKNPKESNDKNKQAKNILCADTTFFPVDH